MSTSVRNLSPLPPRTSSCRLEGELMHRKAIDADADQEPLLSGHFL